MAAKTKTAKAKKAPGKLRDLKAKKDAKGGGISTSITIKRLR